MPCRGVVTAGGRVDGAFAALIGTPTKALAPFGGGVLIDPILHALHECGISEIAVVGGADVGAHLHGRGIRMIDAAADGATNVLRALAAWTDGDLVYATSDLPFVDAAALGAFVVASPPHALTMPLAAGTAYDAAFPGAPPHITSLGSERVANGSVFYLSEAARIPLRRVAARFFDARKSRIGMARLLGPGLLLRFLIGQLRIAHVEARARATLGVNATAIRNSSPALCFDIDTLDDYRYACARL